MTTTRTKTTTTTTDDAFPPVEKPLPYDKSIYQPEMLEVQVVPIKSGGVNNKNKKTNERKLILGFGTFVLIGFLIWFFKQSHRTIFVK